VATTREVLHLAHDDVVRAVPMTDAIDAIALGCKIADEDGIVIGERQNLRFPGGWIRLMPAAMPQAGVFGYKEFHLVTDRDHHEPRALVRYFIHLFDISDGRPLAVIDANHLTALRTGAAAAVATTRMARSGSSTVAVIGSGGEARSQIEGALAVLPVSAVRVFSRTAERREGFAVELADRTGVDVVAVEDPQTAIRGAHVVIVATLTDGEPALWGEWLEPGQHVSSIGSTMPEQREIDPEVWRRAAHTVVDTRQALIESGDAIHAARANAIDEGRIGDLIDLVVGRHPGRTSEDEITLYKSVGTGMQDLVVAELAYRRAKEMGVGTWQASPHLLKYIKPN
jgi:alanine dehydrogenase